MAVVAISGVQIHESIHQAAKGQVGQGDLVEAEEGVHGLSFQILKLTAQRIRLVDVYGRLCYILKTNVYDVMLQGW